jgi:hypothetical protein
MNSLSIDDGAHSFNCVGLQGLRAHVLLRLKSLQASRAIYTSDVFEVAVFSMAIISSEFCVVALDYT